MVPTTSFAASNSSFCSFDPPAAASATPRASATCQALASEGGLGSATATGVLVSWQNSTYIWPNDSRGLPPPQRSQLLESSLPATTTQAHSATASARESPPGVSELACTPWLERSHNTQRARSVVSALFFSAPLSWPPSPSAPTATTPPVQPSTSSNNKFPAVLFSCAGSSLFSFPFPVTCSSVPSLLTACVPSVLIS